ncbi:MAG: hydroxymethylglutaryl-CoA lyase, partial [Zoogloea sp.]|nr:hydroxymethylglutaryl-CoA lyase [Zoogloea sp.]
YLLDGLGIEHGVNLERLVDVSAFMAGVLGRAPASRVAQAVLARRKISSPAACGR